MRKAAGIMLIVIGIVQVIGMIINVIGSDILFSAYYRIWVSAYWPIVFGGLFVTGGISCLRKKYWELCLTSALLALVGGIHYVVTAVLLGTLDVRWQNWILVVGALISTVFISRTKKEWKEISDSMNYEVSDGG